HGSGPLFFLIQLQSATGYIRVNDDSGQLCWPATK
ncbi:MAG: hypothetical protein RL317_1103, partial [Pseudomonadota bacterium]